MAVKKAIGKTVEYSVDLKLAKKTPEKQVDAILDFVLNGVKYSAKDKPIIEARIKPILDSIKTGEIKITRTGDLEMSSEVANKVCEALTFGEEDKVVPEDIKTADGLVSAIGNLKNALVVSTAAVSALYDNVEAAKKEIDELEGENKRYKKAQKRLTIVAGILLGTTLVGSLAAGHFGASFVNANKNLEAEKEKTQIAEQGRIEAEDALKDLGVELDTTKGDLDAANKELGEVAGIVGAENGEDVSDKVQDVINNSGSNSEADKELNEVIGALGDNYQEGADISDVVSGVVNRADYFESIIGDIEDILTDNNQEVIDGNVAEAVATLVAGLKDSSGITPEDGVHQSDVDAVWSEFIESLAGLGVTEEAFKDEEGNFTLDKVEAVLGPIVTEAIENKATLANIEGRVKAIVEKIEKEDGSSYSFEADFGGDVLDAIDFIQDELDRVVEENTDLIEENADLEGQVEDLTAEIEELKTTYEETAKELEDANKQLEDVVKENDNLKEENEDLKEENEVLKDALDRDSNSNQTDTEVNEENSTNTPVTDKEPDENTNPGQSDKNNGSSRDEEVEPGN